jgi:hypothetical protein
MVGTDYICRFIVGKRDVWWAQEVRRIWFCLRFIEGVDCTRVCGQIMSRNVETVSCILHSFQVFGLGAQLQA